MTHAETIDRWPSLAEFHRDLRVDVRYENVRQMRRLDSIPARYWKAVVEAAERRGFSDITYETLAAAAARRHEGAA